MTAQPRLLGGRYEIGGVLGYGGMAEVHRGNDLRLGRDVAIKMLRTDLARDETFLTRFRREAQNAASLNHPSIVAVYDTGEDTGNGTPVPYIVMEYVEGRTLKELLVAEGRLTPRRACEIVADVCAALDFSHRHQIIHRDVKPGNVMLSSNGQVKVMDFGIARAMASGQATMTQTSAVIGTAQYLSPEQARGETVDARSDVYATGCLIYELLCGDPPFTGDNPVSVAYQHVREAPKPPSQLNPDVPPAVDAIVLKALAKNPANRYQSAGEMRDDLERAIAGRPVMATPVMGDDERTQLLGAAQDEQTRLVPAAVDDPEKRSHTGRNVLITALVLLLIAGLGVGGWFLANGNRVDVPDVVGMEQDDATAALEAKGLKWDTETVVSSTAEEGIVLKQDPKNPASMTEGETVDLEVGGGPAMIEVPNLANYKDLDAAKAELKDRKLVPVVEEVDSAEETDTILDQDPAAGEEVAVGSEVTIEVSNGNIKTVPDVNGMSEEDACGELDTAGFTCSVTYVKGDSASVGKVSGQDPSSGQQQQGGEVAIEVVGVEVPDFANMTVDEARAAAVNLNLEVEPTEAEGDWVVESQSEPAETVLKPDSTVSITAKDDGLPGT